MAIDEKKLIEDVWKHSNNITSEWETAGILNLINKQPKVGEWIPVSKRLPESKDKYAWFKCNVTIMRSHWPTSSYDVCDSPYDEFFVTEAMYDTCQKIWHIGDTECLNALIDIEDSPLNGDYVIAWQDLPEPYKGE